MFNRIKRILKRLRKNYINFKWSLKNAIFNYPQFSEVELIDWLKNQGIKKGDTVFVHSSWDRFTHFTGTPKSLIVALLEFLGESGTLAMPAFPLDQDPNKVFSVTKTVSGAGYITEIFRRWEGVERSINLNHSVCAYGTNANYLVKDHHKSLTTWDENSPYFRLKNVDAWIVGLGVGHNLKVATALHCADSILCREIVFFRQLFAHKTTYKYQDKNGNYGIHTYYHRLGGLIYPRQISRRLSKTKLREGYISNLEIYAIPADYLIDNAIELGRGGVTVFIVPIPWPWKFKKIR